MINRKEYLDQLAAWREKQIIKVVTGVRRSGKSTLFALYMNELKASGVAEEQIISINLEDLDNESLLDYKSLYASIKERLCPDRMNYIFIDEVQNCTQYEKAVDSLFVKPNVDLYITGSNAYMLSGELATLLSGRYITIHVLPLSFSEYLSTTAQYGIGKKEAFNAYLRFGSFPYITQLEQDDTTIRTYLEGIYNTILVKDVAQREGITDITLLESIIRMLASCIGSPVSAKKISDTLGSSGRSISVNTVSQYLRALTNSFIFYKVDRYDIKGRQHLKTLGKYYLIDTGIRNLLLSGSSVDLGHQIENLVYLELLRRGSKVSIGKLAEKEIDFVAVEHENITYYQVAASVLDQTTLKRELEPLQRISDHHPKILLTLDDIGAGSNYDGIRQINLIDWFLSKR